MTDKRESKGGPRNTSRYGAFVLEALKVGGRAIKGGDDALRHELKE